MIHYVVMIKTFAQVWLEDFWNEGKHRLVPPELGPRLLRKLDMLNRSKELRDLAAPPSNHLHPLHGNRQGQWAVSVSGAWRLCFRFQDGHVYDLELVQYH
jgi:toxin HigB-1